MKIRLEEEGKKIYFTYNDKQIKRKKERKRDRECRHNCVVKEVALQAMWFRV